MLVLTRRVGDAVIIGKSAAVTVLGIKENHVRIGITAPKRMAVDRAELRTRKLARFAKT